VTKAEYDKLVAAEKRLTGKKPPPKKPPKRPRRRRLRAAEIAKRFPPSATSWTLDDFEGQGHNWSAVRWDNANPCDLSVVTGTATGRLRIKLVGGDKEKSAIVRPVGLDFSSRSRIRMDIFNDCGSVLRVAIAIQTNSYYESRWKYLKIGQNNNVTFNLAAGDYKSAATRWTPAARIAKLQSVGYIYLLFYNRSGEILLDNIRALGGG